MPAPRIYDEQAVALAYVDSLRDPYPHEDFREFRRARVQALERFYEIRLSIDGVTASGAQALWLLFSSTAHSLCKVAGPRSGFLETGLLDRALDRLGQLGTEIRGMEARAMSDLAAYEQSLANLLITLFVGLWGPISKPATSEDLLKLGFDDRAEPDIRNYYDYM